MALEAKKENGYTPDGSASSPEGRVDLCDGVAVSESLKRFVMGMNGGIADGILRAHTRGADIDFEGKFMMMTPDTPKRGSSIDWVPGGFSSAFYLDGHYSLGLGYQLPDRNLPLLVAASSFGWGSDWIYFCEPKIPEGIVIPEKHPIMIQIQGPSVKRYVRDEDYTLAREVLRKIHWERALIQMWVRWAQSEQISEIFILPSSMNHYVNDENKDRYFMRYDVTARRCGFKLLENGLYCKPLSQVQTTQLP